MNQKEMTQNKDTQKAQLKNSVETNQYKIMTV